MKTVATNLNLLEAMAVQHQFDSREEVLRFFPEAAAGLDDVPPDTVFYSVSVGGGLTLVARHADVHGPVWETYGRPDDVYPRGVWSQLNRRGEVW